MSIIAEILDAQYERVREFGPEHAIKEWPLTFTDWCRLIDEAEHSTRAGPVNMNAATVNIRTHCGTIRMFRGPQ